jgi:hypothetical protein
VNGSTTTTYDYETIPGSGEVAGLLSSGSTLAPLHDIFGSTLGLVGSSNTLQTQWSYEPFGAPTQTGTPSSFPFLFGGGQYDPTGYYSAYSPRLQHSLSGGSVPYTGGGAQPGVASDASSAQGGGGSTAAAVLNDASYAVAAAGVAAVGIAAGAISLGFLDLPLAATIAGPAVIEGGAAISQILQGIFGSIWDDLFGGGGGHVSLGPKDLAASHRPECVQIGVASICVNQSHPQYPMGLIRVADNTAQYQRQKPPSTPTPKYRKPGDNPEKCRQGYGDSEFATFCYGGAALCVLTLADPLVCTVGIAACAAGSYERAYCLGRFGNEPYNEAAEPPIPDKIPGAE